MSSGISGHVHHSSGFGGPFTGGTSGNIGGKFYHGGNFGGPFNSGHGNYGGIGNYHHGGGINVGGLGGYYYRPYRSFYISPFLGFGGLYGPGYGFYGYSPWYYGSGLFGGGYYGSGYYGNGYYNSAYSSTAPSIVAQQGSTVAADDQYLPAARSAFLRGDYAEAQRLANHSVIDSPNNPRAHEMLSLAFFAQGNFRPAAAEAHIAAQLDTLPDWPTLYRYYNNKDLYVKHLTALENFVKENPTSPEGRFLLGVHHLMMGHKDEAKAELTAFVKNAGQDDVVSGLLKQLGVDASQLPGPAPATPENPPPQNSPEEKADPTAVTPAVSPDSVVPAGIPGADTVPALPDSGAQP